MYRVFYLDEVEDDILVAKQWYAEQQRGLEVQFVYLKSAKRLIQ